jgi:hypothetical protein
MVEFSFFEPDMLSLGFLMLLPFQPDTGTSVTVLRLKPIFLR